MCAQIYANGDYDSDPANDDLALPFPKPLERTAFSDASFDPSDFLSSLTSRFQTLEDLQNELRGLVQTINTELIDLVNDNYQDFLSLGSKLGGGEERVEEIRVGLLTFQRDITGVRDQVVKKSEEIKGLLEEKRALGTRARDGRRLIEIEERVEELEIGLELARPVQEVTSPKGEPMGGYAGWSDVWKNDNLFDDEDEGVEEGVPVKLKRHVEQYLVVLLLMKKYDEKQAFLLSLQDRLLRIHSTLKRKIEVAIRAEPDIRGKQKMIQLRASIDVE